MSYPNWKEHFTQKITGYDPVEAQGLSELGHALVQAQINENEYSQWARKSFEMMSVDLNFFQKHQPPYSLIKRLKESYTWGPEILPVAEWDGHLIILTLEKPKTEIPKELKPIVLLAPVSELNKVWQSCLAELESPTSVESSSESDKLEIESSGMLEGISLEAPTAVTGLDFSGLRPQLAGAVTAITQITKLSENLKAKATTQDEKTVKIEKSPSPKPPPTSEVAIEINTVLKPPTHIPKIPTPPSIPKIVPKEKSVEVKAEPKVIEVLNSEAAISEGPVLQTLQQVAEIYEHRCYLEFNPDKNTALAQFWPAEMNISTQPTPVDLNKDSFLKIVAKIQKPFHGYLIPTESTMQFFQEMNHGSLPENVTVVPLIKSGEVVGAIMGWGPKSQYAIQHLRKMEKIVNQLCLTLGFTPVEQAS
jgi:hypothetical protein